MGGVIVDDSQGKGGAWVRCTPNFLAPLGGCPDGARRGFPGGGHEHWVPGEEA